MTIRYVTSQMSFTALDLLSEKNRWFPALMNKGVIMKIEEEPFSYWVEDYKMYVFEMDELKTFLSWYLEHYRTEYLNDFLLTDGGEIARKYFKGKPIHDLYEKFDDWVKDKNHFISYCVGQYKVMFISKRKDWYFKFATTNRQPTRRDS